MTGPIDAVTAIHNAFRRDIELTEQAVGDDWSELTRDVPQLAGAQ